MKFLGSKTGLKSEILAKLAYGPPYRFYANEPYIHLNTALKIHAEINYWKTSIVENIFFVLIILMLFKSQDLLYYQDRLRNKN